MNNSTIETKRFFKKSSIQLLKAGISVAVSTPFESNEFELSYENIETKKTIETKANFGLLVIASFFIILGILYLFGSNSDLSITFFIPALFIVLIALFTKSKVIFIRSFEGKNIELYFTKRNKEDVLNFADNIIISANSYILNKYSKIDIDLPIDSQLTNLQFLRNKDLLDDETFTELKNQLLKKDNKHSIGYR